MLAPAEPSQTGESYERAVRGGWAIEYVDMMAPGGDELGGGTPNLGKNVISHRCAGLFPKGAAMLTVRRSSCACFERLSIRSDRTPEHLRLSCSACIGRSIGSTL